MFRKAARPVNQFDYYCVHCGSVGCVICYFTKTDFSGPRPLHRFVRLFLRFLFLKTCGLQVCFVLFGFILITRVSFFSTFFWGFSGSQFISYVCFLYVSHFCKYSIEHFYFKVCLIFIPCKLRNNVATEVQKTNLQVYDVDGCTVWLSWVT